MADEFSDYFVRVQDVLKSSATAAQVNRPIFSVERDSKTEKLIALFLDCFDHHTQWTDALPVDSFQLLTPSARRFIARDQILVRFIDKYYRQPKILKSPHIDPPYDVEGCFLSFDELLRDIQSNPITANPQASLELGSNTYTYLIGDVGIGKSLFMMYLFRKVIFNGNSAPYSSPDECGYTVVPIYINVDEESTRFGKLAELSDAWFSEHVVDEIKSRFQASEYLETVSEINKFQDPGGSFVNRARKLTQHLARRKFRLLLLIDNVDRYHFQYSKYRFSDKYKYKQREAVIANLRRLISCFTSRRELGWCGLCVVLVCRDYVYEYLRIGCADPSEKEREFGRAHKLVLEDGHFVTRARLELFEEGVKSIPPALIGNAGAEYLKALRTLLEPSLDPSDERAGLRPEVELILRLGNHGYRSLVEFLDKLEFNLSDQVVFSRLLERQRKNLPTLFLLNLRRRFSQSVGHFPNIFLVDSQVSIPEEFEDAHQKHVPTYWLKYFILKTVINHRSRRVSELLRLFSKIGSYEEHLVRLAIGSLCSTNDSRCLDVDAKIEVSCNTDPVVFATPRGVQLVSPSDTFGDAGLSFCFEFNYLQLVVDDLWLYLPRGYAEKVVVELGYDYLIDGSETYGERAWLMVRAKAYATIVLCTILSAALRSELKRMPSLRDYLSKHKLVPDMNVVRQGLLDTALDLYRIFHRSSSDREELMQHFEQNKAKDDELEKLFDRIIKMKLLVE